MSRNFELLNQIEAELEIGRVAPRATPDTAKAAFHVRSESFSQELLSLAQAVFISEDAKTPHAVVFCGVDRESGSSAVCLELGRILAAYSTRPVCIVDANSRLSRLSKLVNAPRTTRGARSTREECEQISPNLWLATIDVLAQEQDGELAPAGQLKQRVAELRKSFTYILIDAPGVSVGGDAAALGQVADAVIIVLEANITRKAAALRAKETLESMNVRLLGTVLNNRTYPIPEQLYNKL